MSKAFYMRHTHLHKYPKFHSTIRNLQVGNGELVAALFVIPFVFKVGKHMFEIYTLVSEIQPSIDLIFGVKNMFEIEGEVSCRTVVVPMQKRGHNNGYFNSANKRL